MGPSVRWRRALVVAAALATYAAGPGGRLAPRLAVLALPPAVAVATHLVSEQVG